MAYTIIERRPDGATTDVELDGQTYPVPCIVADDDDLHLLLIEGMHLPAGVWHWALGAGVTAVVSTDNQTFALTSTFSDERTENARMGSYVLAETYWLPYTPGMGYLAMVGLALPGPEALADVERVAAEKLAATRPEGFVHLHTHSECSALDGLSTIKEIVAEVKAQGQSAVAVTDHGNCAAHPALALECAKAGIKPIFGMEAYFYEDRTLRGPEHRYAYQHLVLWAMNDVGLHNLWAISTESFATGLYDKKARVDWDLLERFGEGIMCSTACLRGPLAHPYLTDEEHGEETALHNLARLKRIFGDRLYIELHSNQLPDQIKVNNWLVGLAERHKVPMVAVVDSHYAHAEHKHDHRVWLSVQTDSDAADDSSLFGGDQDYHLLTQDEVEKSLSYLDPEVVAKAVANTVRVAERCTAELTGKNHNPVFSRPNKDWASPIEHDIDRLFTMCMDAWDVRTQGKTNSQKTYLARFEREIGLIIDKGFAGYFLMVADFVIWAKKHKILVGPGRGSGGGSLVAYLLQITEIDPVEADLLFERFMTEGRTALPDFDIDFPSSKKQVLLGYVGERWGLDHIATVGTHMRLKSKGIINDVARAIKSTLPEDYYVDTKACSAIIKEAEAGTAGLGLSWEDLWDEHGEVLDPFRERYPELFGYCDKLHGRLKSFGTHPAGVIIDPDNPLSGALPLRNGENGMVTQWDMEALEALGFVKFDMLNLRTLDTLQGTLDLIEKTTGRWIDIYGWRDEYEDPQIYEQISEGWTLGIFQIETTSGTQMVRRFRPETLAELADVITLVRPGPVRSGLTETYFRRRTGEEEVWLPDERLAPVLAKTYGCMVYQEDIMAATMVLAAYGSDEADTVRRILGKKKVEAVLAEGEKFVQRCIQNDVESDIAVDLWEQMAEFAKYSFNRAHAFAYATIGLWTAWLKFHYPVQFLTAALSTVKPERIPEFVEEARRMGYAILPPDINDSGMDFTATSTAVRYGLLAIKGVGEAAVGAIMKPRAEGRFTSFEDFMTRVVEPKGSKCNMGIVKKLIHIGAFDSLEPNRRGLELHLEALEFVNSGTDSCEFKTETFQPIFWTETKAEEVTEHETTLPCSFDWPAEPDTLGRTQKPVKRKAPPKKCTRGCRQFTPAEPIGVGDVEPYTAEEIGNIEVESLGVFLSWTPFHRIPEEVRGELSTATEILTGDPGIYLVGGWIQSIRMKAGGDRYGRAMGWMSVMTERGEMDITVFSNAYEKYRKGIRPNTLALMAVEKNSRGQTLHSLESAD